MSQYTNSDASIHSKFIFRGPILHLVNLRYVLIQQTNSRMYLVLTLPYIATMSVLASHLCILDGIARPLIYMSEYFSAHVFAKPDFILT